MANASTIGALRVVLGLDSATFTGGLNKAQAHLKKVGAQMQKTGQQLRTVGLALNAAVIGATTAAGVAVLKLSEQVTDLAAEAKTAGVAFKEFQALKYAADRNQISLAALTDGLKELQLRTDEFVKTGKGSGAEAFQRLGFTADDLSKRLKNPTALFEEIISRMERLDKAAQIRISDEIFGGTGGEQFVRFLDQGVAGIRALRAEFDRSGNLITPEQVKRASDLRNAVQRLRDSVANVARAFLDTGITQWLTEVATSVANATARFTQAVPGIAKWATIIGVGTIALGGLLVVIGTAVSAIGGMIPVFTALAVSISKVGGVLAALRLSMMFLVTNPWALAISAIAVAIGFLVVKTAEGSAAQKALRAQVENTDKALQEYKVAIDEVAAAEGEAKKNALEAAAVKRAQALSEVVRTRALWEEIRALRARRLEEQRKSDEALANPVLAMGPYAGAGQASVRSGRQAAVDRAVAEEREAEKAYRDRLASLNELDAAARAAAAPIDISIPDLSGGNGNNNSSGRTAAELAFARESLKLQAELEAAKMRADSAEVRRLEDIIDRRTRIEAYEGQELSNAAAQIAADRDRALIARAREAAQSKALSDREDELALQIAQLDGDQKIVDLMERKRDLAELTRFYESQSLDTVEAERRARADLLRIEEARARSRQKLLRDAAQEHQIRLAELSGNERLLKQLRDAKEIEDRSLRYQNEGGLNASEARLRAMSEVNRERSASTYGENRDMFSSAFSDGIRAAMAGDLKGFLSNQFGEFMSQSFKRLGERVFDKMFGGFDAVAEGTAQGTAQGAAVAPAMIGAGATVAATIAASLTTAGQAVASSLAAAMATAGSGGGGQGAISGIGNILSSLPKFSTGAIIPPSGASGIDSQLVSFWKSPREQVSVLNPGQHLGGGGGNAPYFDLRGAVMTQDLLNQMNAIGAQAESRANTWATKNVPGLTQSQTAKQQTHQIGRRKR